MTGGSLESLLSDAHPGTFLYDADEADYGAFATQVINGPMVNPDLPPGHITPFEFVAMCDKRVIPLGDNEIGPFTEISLDIFEAMLRKIPGMRIGKINADGIHWETV